VGVREKKQGKVKKKGGHDDSRTKKERGDWKRQEEESAIRGRGAGGGVPGCAPQYQNAGGKKSIRRKGS